MSHIVLFLVALCVAGGLAVEKRRDDKVFIVFEVGKFHVLQNKIHFPLKRDKI